MDNNESEPKYPKPKVLLIDLPDDVFKDIKSAGFNVSNGTFGTPYKVEANRGLVPISIDYNLPNHTEQEIIIIDLIPSKILEAPANIVELYDDQKWWWGNCERGVINYSSYVKTMRHEDFDRILKHGGIFVVFADSKKFDEIIYGIEGNYGIEIIETDEYDNWSFLSVISELRIESDSGNEIKIDDNNHPLNLFLKRYFKKTHYNATFSAWNPEFREKRWIPLMHSKYDKCIAGLIVPGNDVEGWILILPQVSKTSDLILSLLNEVLPDLSSSLFPYSEGRNWIEKDEYALSSVLSLKTKKQKVIQDAEKKIKEIDQKILDDKSNFDFIYRIITGTGDDLVDDIEKCLKFIGFNNVQNVDKELENYDKHRKQEDLRICDKSPSLLLEVKGITGYPSEDDMSQVSRYVLRRIKDWNRTDVRGVSIINHYRNIPALERDDAFTEPQIKDAENSDITILTTWDLFLLIKGSIEWNWDTKNIQNLFYKSGRMSKVPSHYKPIGKVFKYWSQAEAISIDLNNKLCKGDRIGYFLHNMFLEEDVLSLKLDGNDVEEVNPEEIAGIKTIYSKDVLKKGTIVYKIENL